MAGSDAVGRLFDGLVGFYVEGPFDRLGGGQVAGDLTAEAEHFEALGHHHGAVHGGETGDEVRHLEDGLVQERQAHVTGRFVVVPADGVSCGRTGVGEGELAHHVHYERAEAAARLRVDEPVLQRHVAAFEDVVGQIGRDDDHGSSMMRVPDGGGDPLYRVLPYYAADVVVEAGPH